MYDPLAGKRPAPKPMNFTKPFWEAAKQKKFLLQYDPEAKKHQFNPRAISIFTGKRNLEWREASGKGKVYAFTITHRPPAPITDVEPYIIATVDLDEGVRMMVNIVNCRNDEIKTDMPVRVTWVAAGDYTYPVFEPDR
jgi:uncharacterized OB-fold protein